MLPCVLPPTRPLTGSRHGYHLFPVQVADRDACSTSCATAGIGVQVHYVPIYRHRSARDGHPSRADFPNTEAAYERLLSLPLYPELTEPIRTR